MYQTHSLIISSLRLPLAAWDGHTSLLRFRSVASRQYNTNTIVGHHFQQGSLQSAAGSSSPSLASWESGASDFRLALSISSWSFGMCLYSLGSLTLTANQCFVRLLYRRLNLKGAQVLLMKSLKNEEFNINFLVMKSDRQKCNTRMRWRIIKTAVKPVSEIRKIPDWSPHKFLTGHSSILTGHF